MQTIVYGASDDLIEVEGALTEEFPYSDGDAILGFSDGTLLRIRYDEGGVWRISPIVRGPALQGIDQVAEYSNDDYSDRATLTSEATWVLRGSHYAVAGAR